MASHRHTYLKSHLVYMIHFDFIFFTGMIMKYFSNGEHVIYDLFLYGITLKYALGTEGTEVEYDTVDLIIRYS